jgi:hypothetical protein
MNPKQHSLSPNSWLKKAFLAIIYCLVTQFSYAALSGTYTINPGGSASATNYKTIKSAISDLTLGTRTDGGTPNGAGVSGAVIFELSSTYTSSSETFPLTFGAITGVSSSNSITVRPASNVSSVLTISGSNSTAIFLMDGCENIIFDGRPGGVGNNLYLNISNLSSSGVAISYLNDASFNTVKYCTLRGVNPTSNKGVVIFGSTTGTTGNDSNTIDNCHIRDGLTTPQNGIYSQGTLDKENTGNIISNNHIYNFFTTGAGAHGINLNLYNEGWTIIGNHLYQTATRTPTSSNPYRGIAVVGGGGHLISSNSIGGSAANTGGSAWTHNASTAHSFWGIYLSVDTAVATSVQGNTIANFSFTFANANSSTSGIWNGIIISAGKVNVGTITGNTIGDTSTGSINVVSSLTGGAVMGIRTSSTAVVNISNNSIGSINASGSSASISCSIYGISIGGRCLNVSNNIIGNVSTANSLNAITSSNSTTGQFIIGIHNTSSQNLPINITNNTIANLNNNYIGAATNGQVVGISSSNGVNTITENTIYNLSTSSKNPNNVATSILGISITSSNGASGSQSVSQNLIHTLTNTTDTAAVRVLGIYASCPTSGTHYLSKNFIHSLNLSSSNANSVLAGIQIFQGTGTIIQNNMIRLGINASGNSITKGCNIYGIYQNGGNNLNFYHNSVYIGGSGVISVGNTAAFYRIISGFAMKLYNNVLVNARSNSSGSAYNAALWLTAPTDYTVISSNNNILYAPGIGGTVGLQQTNAYTTLPLWQEISKLDSSSGSGNPGFVNPTSNATLVDLHISGNSPVESFGRIGLTVNDDFDGNLRDSLSVDIGADAGNFTAVDAFFPFIGFTPINDLISSTANLSLAVSITDIGLGVPTSGSNRPRIWFRRLAPATSAWISTQGTFNSGNANNGNWTFNLNYSSLGITPTIGETYEYYLVAQDQVSTPNLRSNPLIGASHTDVNTQGQVPTTPHSFSIVAPLATTINVGSGQTFTTLTGNGGVFEIINNVGLTGNTVVNITSDLIEDGTHSLKGTGLNSFTLTIQPNKDSIRTISNNGNLAVSMLRFEGVTGVTIDGRNGGSGRYFRFINTHTTPTSCKAAIEIFGSSTNSFIRNCIIESNSTSSNFGNIFLGIGTNTGIGIRNNDIRDAQGTPGTPGIPRILMYSFSDKNVVSIEDNNFHNFTQYGINLGSVGNGCRVSGNSVYYNASTIPNTNQVGISVSRGDSQTIVGNFIGGQSPNCGDSAWTNNGNITFYGIQVSLGTITPGLLKGNVIQNIRLTGTGSSSFYGLSSSFGLANMDSNLVGHPSIANSIYSAGGTVSGGTQNIGILNSSNVANVTSVVSNNTVANITSSTSNSNTSAILMGIYSNVTTSNNTIFNISSNAATSVTTSAPVGIFNSGATSSQSVNNNTIYNLSNTNTTAVSPAVNGIVADGVLSNFITNNRIYGLSNSATGVTPAINGILNNNNVNLTIANNQISLTNDTNTNSVVISGIQCTFTTGNILYNSVYIGGSGNSKSYGFLRLTSYAVTLRNNLLYNERSGTSGNHYAIGNNFATPATGWSSSASNNNLYVVSNLNKMGEWGGSSQTLAQWNSSSAGDSNSVVQLNSTIPSSSFFTGVSANPINLGISNSSQVYVKDLGTPISAITTDYNGNPRPTSTTSIGAFEYSVSSSSNNANLISMLLSSGTLNPSFDSLQISYTSSVVNSISSITLTPTKSQANATIEIRVNGGTYASLTSGTASGSLALNVGSNTIDVRVTAQNGTTQKIYTVTITRAAGLSDNANLIAMLLSSGTLNPSFDSLQTNYTSSVVNSISSITLTPTKSQANATIEIRVNGGTYTSLTSGTASGSLALNVGSNTIDVRVTAQNGTTQKIYTVTVTRAGVGLSDNANLISMLMSTGTLNPSFDSLQTSYTSSVVNSISSITLTPTKSQANATIEIRVNGGTYASVTSGTASGSLALNVGSNTINVRVTAQNETTQKIYTVTVTRAGVVVSDNANLVAMLLSSGTLNPTFDSLQTNYTSSVVNSISSITLTPTKSQANATIEIRVNGGSYASVTSGTASGSLALNVGSNTINVRVTAQNETTQKIYTVTVTRAGVVLSDNANLVAMLLSSGTLNPTFDSLQTNYTSSVVNSISSITLTPTKSQANATIEIRVNGGSYASVTSGTASGSLALNVGPNTINVRVTAQNETTQKVYTVTVTRAASNPDPIISINGTLDTFSSCSGTVSFVDSFTVSGSNLAANITILAPTGFEISTTAASGFTNNLNLPQSSGSVASTKIYVRLSSSATGTPSGSIVLYSSGDNSEVLAVTGIVNVLPSITLGTIGSVFTTATTFNLPFTSGAGSPNQYTILAGTPNAMPSFTAVNNASLVSSPILVSIPASAANMYNFNLTVKNTTTGCISNNIPFTLSVGNPSISNNIISGNQLICSGSTPTSLVGSSPEGGNNSYTYSWIKSTSTASSGYTAAIGSNNLQNYLPPVLAQNTWFKRIVNSGTYSDTSNVVLVSLGDTTKPIARPRNLIAYLNNSGTLNLTGAQVDSASFDNCGILSKTLSKSSFNCSNIGSNQVYLIITDAIGNKDSALSTITVLDTIAPIAIAQNRTIYLNTAGNASITASAVNNGSSDVCGIAGLSINKTSFDCSNLGNNTITLTVSDVNGNFKTTQATITVLDTIKPVVSLNSGIVLYLNSLGNLGISASQFVNSSSDNCGISSTTINPSSINCSHLGITTVTVTIADANGNKDSVSTNAIVLDPIAPIARPKARLTIYLSGNGQAVINPALLDSASSDNCSITSRVLSQSVFNCNNIGTNNVTFTVQDQSGNSHAANVVVTVFDTIAPVATVSNQLVYLNNAGTATITAAQVNNNSTDNCGILSVSINKTSFNCSDLGNRTILFTVTDLNANIKQTPVTVNVYDTIRPVMRPKRNLNVYLNALGTASLSTTTADSASSDNCNLASRSLNQSIFTCANLGANTIILSGSDSTGNIGSASFTVNVLDTITPILTTKPATIYLSNSGTATLTSSQVVLNSSDNCGLTSTSLSASNFTCANLGNNNVTVTATDGSTNSRSGIAIVSVADTLKPNALAQNKTIYLNASGLASITAAQVDNGSTDNCTITSRSISKSNFTIADLGSNLINFTVTDNSNNSSQTQVQISVLDTIRPIVQTQNRSIYLNNSGTATVSVSQVNNGSSDNVGINSFQLSKTVFTCADLGINQVFLTLTDISNNSSSASANITVLDTIKPVVNTQNVTLYLNAIGQATLSTNAANNSSTDNCGITSLSLSKTLFTCNDKGVNTIQLNALDASNNSASANLQVTVLDTVKPNVVVNNNLTLYLNSSGTANLTTSMANNGSTDNCGIQSQTLSKTSFNGTNLGLNLVNYTIADASNNQSSVVLNISVLDTIRPILNAQNRTIYLDAGGNAVLTPAMVNNGSTDNVAVTQFQLSKTSFNCSNIGVNQVSFSIADISNNQTSTLVNISVLDTIKPVALAQNLTVYLNAAGITSISTEQANNGSSDNCSITNISLSKQNFSCADRGINIVSLTLKDASNNSSTVNFNVTVLDTIKPVILANPMVLLYLDNSGNANLNTSMVNLGTYDNCNNTTLSLSKTAFNGSNLGVNQVLFTAADASNNQTTVNIVVNVIDTVRPIVKAKDLTLYLNNSGSVFLTPNDVNNGSTDNVGISYSTISKSLFTCNETGTNLIEFSVQDISGNRSAQWISITVLDTILPVITSFPSSVVLGHCNQDFQFTPPYASDNCGLITIVQTSGIPNGRKYPVGTTTNTFTFNDRSGNVVSRSFTVRILPAYLPDTFPNRTACSSDSPFDLTRGNANVEFSGSGVSLDGFQFDPSLAGPGNHAVICTFTDSTGCETKATFYVTVYRSPDKPVIERMSADVLQVVQSYDFYQWRRNYEDIPGANQRSYAMTKTGIYSVRVGTVAGCSTESDLLGVGVALGLGANEHQLQFNLFPNPTQDRFRIDVDARSGTEFTIRVFDLVGKMVYESIEKGFTTDIDASLWKAGTYMVHIESDNKSAVKPVIITK